VLLGHGETGSTSLVNYLYDKKKDPRASPFLVLGKDEAGNDAAYAVWVWRSEKLAKLALATKDAYVCYDGHSNFGLGFAFSTGFTNISQFMNAAEDLVAIDWPYLRTYQQHPDLMISDSEYGDDTTTPEEYDPWQSTINYRGSLGLHRAKSYSSQPVADGTHLSLTRGPNKWEDYHVVADKLIVVKSGKVDMPSPQWKKVFLNSCSSGDYYHSVFGHGVLFFTYAETYNAQTTKTFVSSIVDGDGNGQIWINLENEVFGVHDYQQH
jgi:hypothetical protein